MPGVLMPVPVVASDPDSVGLLALELAHGTTRDAPSSMIFVVLVPAQLFASPYFQLCVFLSMPQ